MNREEKITTIFIVNWNTSKIIQKCLSSIEGLDDLSHVKVVVVDNASTDNSVKKIKSYRFVHLVKNRENIGVVKSINNYIPCLDTPYFLLMHSDVMLSKDTIRKMVSYMEGQNNIAALGCKLLYPNGQIFQSTFYEPKLKYLIQECLPYRISKVIHGLIGLDSFYMNFWEHNSIRELDSVGSACVLIRKKAVDDVGNIPDSYSNWLIEMEWFKMMREKGWQIVYYPEACAYHYEKYAENLVNKDTEYKSKGYVISDKLAEAFLCYYKRNFSKMSFLVFKSLSLCFFLGKILKSRLIADGRKRTKYYIAGIRQVITAEYEK